ncbi:MULTISPECIES: glycan-binding surface protein [Niastella]|uniref:IPT/TIG domain-containing protein n=1 Tax=Niastella soli TaxID=2821487 RepID=A0ABS3Z4X5_9BACT|nr:glycan-binding surface protein [Niastella soli]MBO9205221.1 IPT/TIG domain-containing protein [Niastella soli]
MNKHILRCTVFCILATILYTACKKDDIHTPGNLSVSPAAALPETFITLNGTDIQDIVSIKFDTATASFSSVFNTGSTIFTNVPTNPKFGPQQISITNRDGKTATVDFTVLQPAPRITSFSPTNVPVGDTVTITGTMFTNINGVYIGNIKAPVIDSSSRTQLKIKVPAGAASGLLSIVTWGGTTYGTGTLTIGERAYLISDFDGGGIVANSNDWLSYGDMKSKAITNTDPAPKTGNFIKAIPLQAASANYGGVSSPSLSTTFGMTSTTAGTTLKFDVNNNGQLATVLQVIVQETASDIPDNNYAKNVSINGTGWNTIEIPLTQLRSGYGGGSLNPDPAKITKVKFHFQGYASNPMEADIDNVRFAY